MIFNIISLKNPTSPLNNKNKDSFDIIYNKLYINKNPPVVVTFAKNGMIALFGG